MANSAQLSKNNKNAQIWTNWGDNTEKDFKTCIREVFDSLTMLYPKYQFIHDGKVNNQTLIESFNQYLLNNLQLPSLEPFFETLYLSYEVGLRKPDLRIFEYVLQDAGLLPERTLFIDDSIQHIQAASELGILTKHLVNEDITTFLEGKI